MADPHEEADRREAGDRVLPFATLPDGSAFQSVQTVRVRTYSFPRQISQGIYLVISPCATRVEEIMNVMLTMVKSSRYFYDLLL